MTLPNKRFCEINNLEEVKDLRKGMDFRKPEYRREWFIRFYGFHLINNSHPGCVYYALPWLTKYYSLNMEDKLWMAFINGCSQNIVTTSLIFERFPTLKSANYEDLTKWWNTVHSKFKSGSGWDSDRKYFKIGKTGFPECVASYAKAVEKFGSQENLFNSLVQNCKYKTFDKSWEFVRENFLSFGRLSTFSYLEYLRIQDVPLDCSSLFLDDISGSKSHRNGLCKVLGRDDLDWWDVEGSETKSFEGYDPATIDWLVEEGAQLLEDTKEMYSHKDISYFTLESTLCCSKSFYRPNRRYPNVYNDMFFKRIKYAEGEWGNKFDHFWKMRKESIPKYLRLEDNEEDPTHLAKALDKEKQNHFRETGQLIMMDDDWKCFKNSFNDKYYHTPHTLSEFFD